MLFLNFFLAILPILWLIIALSILKIAGHKACVAAFVLTVILAMVYWKMNVGNALTAGLEGVLNALWPICLVIIAALFTYNLTLQTGAMDKIKKMLASVSRDERVLLLIIGWGFGNFMEGMAGFGTAVAIPASMLAGIGLNPILAVIACLVVNSTPTAFGSVGVPTVTLASVTGLEALPLAGDVALIQCVLTFLSPFFMVCIMGKGLKALKGVLPMVLIAALSFTVPWFVAAQFIGCELPDIIGSMVSLVCMVATSRLFNKEPEEEYAIVVEEERGDRVSAAEGVKAWSPYIFIFFLLMFTSTLCPPIHNLIAGIKTNAVIYSGEGGSTLTFSWINTPGIMIFIAAIIGGFIQKASVTDMLKVLAETLKKYWKTILTICSVMATAKIMGYSGMISDIANVLVVVTGPFYPFISPFIGALGAFVTGSGTSTCVLFGGLQSQTAISLGLNPSWMAAANVMGAGIGKMICPQCIAIGAGAINAVGKESEILRAVFKYFVIYVVIAGIICFAGSAAGL